MDQRDGSVVTHHEVERHEGYADSTAERAVDAMAKGFAGTTTSRQQVLKGLVGTLLGGGVLEFLPGGAGAKPRPSRGRSSSHGDGRRPNDHGGGDDQETHHGGEGNGVCPP